MDKAEQIKALRFYLLTRIGELALYSHRYTNDERLQSLNQLKKDWEDSCRQEKLKPLIDPNGLTESELRAVGFSTWSETQPTLFLIPAWFAPFIDPEAKVIAIDDEHTYASEMDPDLRFGCLAYGVHAAASVPILASVEKSAQDHALSLLFTYPETITWPPAGLTADTLDKYPEWVTKAKLGKKVEMPMHSLVTQLFELKDSFLSFYKDLHNA